MVTGPQVGEKAMESKLRLFRSQYQGIMFIHNENVDDS